MRQLVQKEVLLVSGAGSCGGSSKHARKSCSKPSTPRTGCSGTPTPPVTPPVTPPAIN